jgi:ligand-binding sensor domain-containing protein
VVRTVRLLLMVLLVLAVALPVCAGVGEWKTFTAKREVRDIARSGAMLWAATSGGLFSYNTATGAYAEYTTSEGLKTIDLTAIAADGAGNLWIGASNGVLHKYSPLTGQWTYITDIAILDNPQKRINALRTSGDTLYILSNVGLSLYSISRSEFGDTYARFGAAPGQITGGVTSMARLNDTLWVGTRSGAASTPAANPNPSAPDSWQVVTAATGLPSNVVTALDVENGVLYAATASGIASYAGGYWSTLLPTPGLNVLGMVGSPSALFAITSSALFSYDLTGAVSPIATIYDQYPSALTCIADPGTIGTLRSGVQREAGGTWSSLYPAGPSSNRFVSVAVGARGILWAGTGASNGEGAMRYDGTRWTSYTAQLYPELRINDIHKVSIGANNSAWLSSWGSGTALVDEAGRVRRTFNTDNNDLPPSLDGVAGFVVANGVATDRYGVAWITNRTAGDSTAVVRFRPDSTIDHGVRLSMRDPDIAFTDVVIDFNNTKWFANYSRFENASRPGLLYYNEGLAVSGSSGGWGRVTAADGLTSDAVWSVAVDRQGEVWVGSEQGISILFDPLYPKQRMAVYHPLRDQIIQAIAVDALNNKWIGTKQGAAVLSPDGTSILAQYTAASTDGKLLDDDVASIAIDNESGTVYFGTEKGLSALTTPAITPLRSFEELTCSPNPYLLPSQVPLTVDGLVQNSTFKVLTVEGKLVREIATPGGRLGFWDGRDAAGNLAATGVYLVVAYSEDGSKVMTGKVAVVRR